MNEQKFEVVDLVYGKDEFNVVFVGTYKECECYIKTSGSDFGYKIRNHFEV
jgi:hypothetical protein